MGLVETNQSLSTLLGWSASDFGKTTIDMALVGTIRETQARLSLTVDGICGKATYGALLKEREDRLLSGRAASAAWLADAGMVAVCEAKRAWLRNIVDLPPSNDPRYTECREAIDEMIRSDKGLNWTWQETYKDNYEWCGAFAGYSWRAASLSVALRKTYFASTYRLDRYAHYEIAFENTTNPKPASGPLRKVLELNEHSGPFDAYFGADDPPRAGDILLVGGKNTAYGKHVTLVESYDSTRGIFTTLEGNATGPGPSGGTRHGVIRGRRPVGLAGGVSAMTYHARRLIRPSPSDLS